MIITVVFENETTKTFLDVAKFDFSMSGLLYLYNADNSVTWINLDKVHYFISESDEYDDGDEYWPPSGEDYEAQLENIEKWMMDNYTEDNRDPF